MIGIILLLYYKYTNKITDFECGWVMARRHAMHVFIVTLWLFPMLAFIGIIRPPSHY